VVTFEVGLIAASIGGHETVLHTFSMNWIANTVESLAPTFDLLWTAKATGCQASPPSAGADLQNMESLTMLRLISLHKGMCNWVGKERLLERMRGLETTGEAGEVGQSANGLWSS